MRKLYYLFVIFFFAKMAVAQQMPHYTQYVLNNYILNPALSGIENYMDVKISARDQWVGLNGAPRTAYLSIHGPLGKKDYKTSATSFDIPGGNPRGNAYWETYTASEPHHGVGLVVLNDKTGNFNRFTADVSYAYHIGLSPTTNLAAGFSAGISQIYRDAANTDFGEGSYDPAQTAGQSQIKRTQPDLNAGLWLYSRDYFIGLSAQQIIPQKVSYGKDAGYGGKLVPHIFATTGYRFLASEDVNIIPSVMFKYVPYTPSSPQFDINVKCQYRDFLWAGAGYRLNDGYSAMLGMNIGNTMNIGYAYDFTKSRLNTVSRGTHEIVLGFLINNRYGDTCPRNIW